MSKRKTNPFRDRVSRFFPGGGKNMVKTGKNSPGKKRFWTGLPG